MSNYPNRCQHLKTNGTQCGSPALRRNRFCYFHKRYQDERIRLNLDRRRSGTATFYLPVLEDANSIQMSLMQIMRLLLTGQLEHKTASLLLYALQTASTNLRLTEFRPRVHQVILDPRDARDSVLDQDRLWNDEDFEDEDDEQEEDMDPNEREIQAKIEEAVKVARVAARFDAEQEIKGRERARKRYEDEEKLKVYVQQHPEFMLVRRDGRLTVVQRPKPEPAPAAPAQLQPEQKPAASSTDEPSKEKKTAAASSADEVRARIVDMIREEAPALTKAYNEALQKQAAEAGKKKQPEKERLDPNAEKKAT